MLYIFIRHGQCITNFDREYAVSSNDEDILTETGCTQALKTARFLKGFKVQNLKIASSSLARAKQTANIIFEELQLNNEICFSDLLIEKSREESYFNAYMRYKSFVDGFKENDNLTLIVITHGHLLQAVFANLLRLENPEILDFQNCSISTFENERALTINSYFHLIN